MKVTVSRHAQKRLKERLGLKKRAANRHAAMAFKNGVYPKDYHYRDIGEKYALLQEKDKSRMLIFYNDILYIFTTTHEKEPILITIFEPLSRRPEKPVGQKIREQSA